MKNIEKILVWMCVVIMILVGWTFKAEMDTLTTIYKQQQAQVQYLERLENEYRQACEDRDRSQAALNEIQGRIKAVQEALKW